MAPQRDEVKWCQEMIKNTSEMKGFWHGDGYCHCLLLLSQIFRVDDAGRRRLIVDVVRRAAQKDGRAGGGTSGDPTDAAAFVVFVGECDGNNGTGATEAPSATEETPSLSLPL